MPAFAEEPWNRVSLRRQRKAVERTAGAAESAEQFQTFRVISQQEMEGGIESIS
jgi:hypothetical protein